MHTRNLIAVCVTGLLAACASSTPPPPATPEPTTATAPSRSPAPPAAPQTEPQRVPVRDSVRATPTPDLNPDTIIGLASIELDNLLGSPDLVRIDGPAEVRLYRDGDNRCTFHVFLYASGTAGQSSAVEYFEARDKNGRLHGTGVAECYRALVNPAATS